jgi:hypothetical protein
MRPQLWCKNVDGAYQDTVKGEIGLRYHDSSGQPLDQVDFSTMEVLQWCLVNTNQVTEEDRDLAEARGRTGTVGQAPYIPGGDEIAAPVGQMKVLRKIRMTPEKALCLAFPVLFPNQLAPVPSGIWGINKRTKQPRGPTLEEKCRLCYC